MNDNPYQLDLQDLVGRHQDVLKYARDWGEKTGLEASFVHNFSFFGTLPVSGCPIPVPQEQEDENNIRLFPESILCNQIWSLSAGSADLDIRPLLQEDATFLNEELTHVIKTAGCTLVIKHPFNLLPIVLYDLFHLSNKFAQNPSVQDRLLQAISLSPSSTQESLIRNAYLDWINLSLQRLGVEIYERPHNSESLQTNESVNLREIVFRGKAESKKRFMRTNLYSDQLLDILDLIFQLNVLEACYALRFREGYQTERGLLNAQGYNKLSGMIPPIGSNGLPMAVLGLYPNIQ